MISTDLQRVVQTALAEDFGMAGDLTSQMTVPQGARGTLDVTSREDGALSGCKAVDAVFAAIDATVTVSWSKRAGDKISSNEIVAVITGPAHPILTGERTALNLLGHLTGIASRTSSFVNLVDGTGVRVVDTRKTTPGLRALEKRAVLDGGGGNHRFGLFDAILVKDNHIALGGGLRPVLDRIAAHRSHLVRVEVEVDTLEQLNQLLTYDAQRLESGAPRVVDAVLLDNMSLAKVRAAVEQVRAHLAPLLVEVSGSVTEESIRAFAATEIDTISVGTLTHSVRCHDFGLDNPSTTLTTPEFHSEDRNRLEHYYVD